eukprot:2436309-Amphidinium_carterae.1
MGRLAQVMLIAASKNLYIRALVFYSSKIRMRMFHVVSRSEHDDGCAAPTRLKLCKTKPTYLYTVGHDMVDEHEDFEGGGNQTAER